jgi:hypothetical protein
MHKTFFSWEILLELLKWSTKPEGGRTPLSSGNAAGELGKLAGAAR